MDSASELFSTHFGDEPQLMVRAPGRVNLMGDHTDYSLLPVLPMAIHQGTTVAAGLGPTGVEAVSDADAQTVLLAGLGTMPSGWGAYLFAILESLGDGAAGRGARLAVATDLPSTGGLASSSALTVAVSRSLNQLWDLGLTDDSLVELATRAERRVGVESGGMDQAVITFAEAGSALRIDFDPPQRRTVAVPGHLSFVIGFSGVVAPKGTTVKDLYNRSVVSCRAAALLLAKEIGIDAGDPPVLRRIGAASRAVVEGLPDEITAADAAAAAGMEPEVLTTLSGGGFFSRFESLFPRSAAQHVLSEARRVDAAEAALLAGDGVALGRLFAESHASLDDFGASTPELNNMTAAARSAGAWGARVTGAGFGGWAVAVCPASVMDEVVAAMAGVEGGPAFAVEPAAGAR